VRGAGRIDAVGPDTVEIRVPAVPENLALARLALAGVGMAAGASDSVVADLKLAVTEAATNSILHGYAEGTPGELVVRYRVQPGTIEVEVEDDGAGFEPGTPSRPRNGVENQGMGLMLIGTLTDSLEIESDDSGSRVSFRKRLDPR
jgi:anti-sigma regulatory factor (Ser/Thr protein kinase)